MAKSKLHPIAKKLGFKTNEEFYQKYPTKGHYEFAMGGYYPEGGTAPGLTPIRPGDVNAQSTAGMYYAPTATPGLNFMDPNWSGATVTPRTAAPAPATAPTTGYQFQYQDPKIQQSMAQRRGFDNPAAWFASGKDKDIVAKMMAYNTANPIKKGGGSVFPQIQTEKGFFSRSYENVNAPYTNGSFNLGGPYAGFGEGHPFPYQPRMPKNGAEAFGVPTRPNIIAQVGGGVDSAIHDQNVYNSTMDAMGIYPQAPADYKFPTVPGAYGQYYGGYDPQPWPPKYSTPAQGPMLEYMNEEDPNISVRKMGGSKKHCYECGGGYNASMHLGGNHKGTLADFNQGPDYFTNKLNKFTEGLRNTATEATLAEMKQLVPPGYHQMPDGSIMSDSEMSYNMGGGTGYEEMFPYAMPYQYAGGGENWIQNAVNPAHKGYCTPMTKKTCTPRRKAFAMTMKKHHGFHKQEGGTPDPAKEAKWQAIIDLTNQGITDPEEIAATLNNEGIYPTNPDEVAGYLQEYAQGQETMKMGGVPKAQAGGWDFTPDYREAERMNRLRVAIEKKTGRALPTTLSNEQIIKMGIDNSLISKAEVDNKSGYDPYGANPYGNYMQGAAGYSGWPGGAYKVKNKFNFYGNPNDRFSAPQRNALSAAANTGVIDPATAKMLKDAGMWYKQDIKNDIWSRIGLARGPKRIHTEFGFGDQPNMGLPYDSGTGTTWVGDKLRRAGEAQRKYGTIFPSKKKKEEYAAEQERLARKANQDSNAFVQGQVQAAADTQFAKDQAMRNSPSWQSQVQDPALIPWLEQTAGRLGVTPESLVNQQAPQTGPAPVQTAAPEKSYAELDAEYKKAVAERDAIFKEHNINKRGRHRNFLGIKYQYGGNNSYVNLPPPSADTMNLLKFNPNDYNMDPNMDPENLPGYVPQPTLSDSEMVQAIEGNPADQLGSGMSMTSDATRKKAGEADFWKDINTMNTVTALANIPHQERLKKKAKFDNRIENRMAAEQYRNRGDYTTNYGYFRPDQQNVGNMVTGKFGGTYQEGGQYDLTEEEIQRLRDGGYDIEYI